MTRFSVPLKEVLLEALNIFVFWNKCSSRSQELRTSIENNMEFKNCNWTYRFEI